jgi:ApaG protein
MAQSPDSDTITAGIRVQAAARYLPEQSDPEHDRFTFTYRVVISNEGSRRAKLQSRHWLIIDAEGHREEVRGPGVVGEFPDLAPGERFEYTSGCPLATSWGTMEGSYQMEREDGAAFDAAIGRFFLVSATAMRTEQPT